jgi:hypothetical protein
MSDKTDLGNALRSRRATESADLWPTAGLAAAGLATAATLFSGPMPPVLAYFGLGPFDAGIHGAHRTTAIWCFALAAALLIVWSNRRTWPKLLLAGTVIELPALLGGAQLPLASSYAFAVGQALVLIAVLAGVQEWVNRRDSALFGLGVSAIVVAAPWLMAAFLGAGWLSQTPGFRQVNLVIGVIGVAGAALTLVAARTDDVTAAIRARPHVLVVGVVAAFLPLLLSYLTTDRLAAILGISPSSLERRSYATVALLGLILLAAASLLTLICGITASVSAATVLLIETGAVAPMLLGVYSSTGHGSATVLGGVIGLVAGVMVAISRWRAPAAALAAVGSALAALLALAATGGSPAKLVNHQVWLPGTILAAGVVFLIATTAATVTPMLAGRGNLPVVFGVLLPVLFLGAKGSLTLTQLTNGEPRSDYLNNVEHITSSAVLLLIGASVLAGLALIQGGRLVWRVPDVEV